MLKSEIVITGIGVVSPIGNTIEAFWNSLLENKSGIGFVQGLTVTHTPRPMGAEVTDFNVKDYFRQKKDAKQSKVMSRDIQLGFASAMLAAQDAGLQTGAEDRSVEPDRLGVSYGADLMGVEVAELQDAFRVGIQGDDYDFSTWGPAAMEKVFPLWMLKYLPNMVGGHIAITHDARGPNNTLTLQRASSMAAIIEGARIIDRGGADVMFCGGCGNCINPSFLARARAHQIPEWRSDPETLPRPYDAKRCGSILSEGSATFILERREFAEARGAKIYAKVRGFSTSISPHLHVPDHEGIGIRKAIRRALESAEIPAEDLSHINADGLGTLVEDRTEAEAIRETLGDTPVTSLKGYFGNIGSGAGAVELVGSLLGLQHGVVPATRNCETVAEDCPIQVVRNQPQPSQKNMFMKLNTGLGGRSFAVVFEKP